jgi:hypothetical protein
VLDMTHKSPNQSISHIPPGEVWLSQSPTSAGYWWMLCGECDGEPELVCVERNRGELWAVDCAIGSLPVKQYHDGLTNCLWQVANLIFGANGKRS